MDEYVELRNHGQTLIERTGMEVITLSKSTKKKNVEG